MSTNLLPTRMGEVYHVFSFVRGNFRLIAKIEGRENCRAILMGMERSEFVEVFNLSPEELVENSNGRISDGQHAILRGKRVTAVINTFVLALLGIGLITMLTLKLVQPAFASRGEILIGLPIGMFWLWLLRSAPVRWRQINRELHAGQVSHLEGRVQCEIQGNIGFVQMPHYLIRINGQTFQTNREIYFQFKHREHYRVFYTPLSETLLGGIQIPPPAGLAKESTEFNLEIEAPTSQEMELLKLIAAGLSNKQIASRLSLSVNTVKMYTSKLYRKLQVHTRTEAVARARRAKLL